MNISTGFNIVSLFDQKRPVLKGYWKKLYKAVCTHVSTKESCLLSNLKLKCWNNFHLHTYIFTHSKKEIVTPHMVEIHLEIIQATYYSSKFYVEHEIFRILLDVIT